MQVTCVPMHRGSRLVTLAATMAVVLTPVLMTGCGGVDGGAMPGPSVLPDSRTASERFKPEYEDYREILKHKADTRKWMAGHGLGALDGEGDPLNRYLNEILQRIIQTSPAPDVPARVVTVDTQEGRSAYAAADGSIHVPYRLLADMDERPYEVSEDALAYLLAHELAHVLYAHEQSDVVGDIFEFGVLATEIGKTIGKEISKFDEDKGEETMEIAERIHKATTAGRWAEETFLSPAWTRGQEEEADILAYDLVVRSGYNAADAAGQFLDLLGLYENAEGQREGSDDSGAGSLDLEALGLDAGSLDLEKLGLDTGSLDLGTLGLDTDSLDLGALVDDASKKLMDQASNNHPTVKGRKKNLEEYVELYEARMGDEYQDIDVRELAWKEEGGREALSDADAATVRKLFENFRSAEEAMKALDDGQRERAAELIEEALSAPTAYHATPRIVAARVAGNSEQSLEHLQLALKGPDPSFHTYSLVLRRLDGLEKYSDVLALLEEAEVRFGPFVDLLRWRAAALEGLGRKEEAAETRSACYLLNVLDKRRNSCQTDIIEEIQ